MRLATAILFCLCIWSNTSAQIFPPDTYPKGYFRNPLNVPVDLAGNFGELRPNHYHMGLDLKTLKRENLPVHAAAEGYIAQVKIEPAGFGRAIYINHPNGYTTVYCHLNGFFPELEDWLEEQQYKLESWRVLLTMPPNAFPVKKGTFLAYSGNTGGSQAPHLHFEIRRTSDDVNVNPMLFGFPLADNTKPSITRLALYDRTRSIYETSPRYLPIKKRATDYTTTQTVVTVTSPKISFGISTTDTHSGSSNANGVYETTLFMDEQPVVAFRMDNISYNDTRYLNAHIDYKTKATGGPFVQQVFELPGYISSIYKQGTGDGTLDVSDGEPHDIRITVKDAYGNTSIVNTTVKYTPTVPGTWQPAGRMYYPLMLDGQENGDCEFYIGERCLYDSVHIAYRKTAGAMANVVSALHSIGATYIPMQDSMLVRIKPTVALSPDQKNRTLMQRYAGTKKEVQKVEWQKDWANARFRDFGNFQLLIDNEPPVIVPVGFSDGANMSKAARIAFTVKDNNDRFKNFRAELDGKWLRFTNDKGRTFIYRFDDKCPAGDHELKVSVQDEAGNITVKTYSFRR